MPGRRPYLSARAGANLLAGGGGGGRRACDAFAGPVARRAVGDHDTRNYYDMIAARQELDLRPQLERLDALLLRSAGVEPDALRFMFRPLWQLSAAEKAQVALGKAQATQV